MKRVLLWESKRRPGKYAPFSSEVANWDDEYGDVDAPIAMGFNNDNYAEAAEHYHKIDKWLSGLGEKWPFTRELFRNYHLTPVELTDEEFKIWRQNQKTGTDSRWEDE
ncbi:tetratricopeptide TPR_2 repeat protein [Weissella oryzae SG25]|uniref:Tetratricopeptide TPR_2 repeat protein n=1 Tax=Weissella oryzae (strain DSM 25784 / JCM 18191 / LMG 30913 / SG25) TaxID=1329250 RepID=A0A069CU21_WEIOS|nr:hypothetical protein [Weissella oryzae]GAK30723.1 tetratricopeptide TPR_2 repeat protein [Weissella oryzae SG25]